LLSHGAQNEQRFTTMQKLVALYLANYTADRALHEHGDRHELLEDYFTDGWKVVSVTPLGTVATPNDPTCTWVTVLLERPDAPANS
jgi:hypothetical protein